MNSAAAAEETWLAWLTPPGAGAIATLAVRGPRAWAVVGELFEPVSGNAVSLDEGASGRFWLGRLGERGGARDEVVLAVKRAGPSPWLELHCHGGREVARMLEELLTASGVVLCSWQVLERCTSSDLLRAEALAALAHALTPRTAAILLDQYQAAFERAIQTARTLLERGDLAELGTHLEALADIAPLGRHLTEPWRVAVLAAPNAGKSSLINALSGYQRSVVSPVPGTTRDLVTAVVAIDGWPIELIDTAGWREDAEALEKQGIELARAVAERADLCLWVMDQSAVPAWPPPGVSRVQFVVNKTDLPPAWDGAQSAGAVHVSAQSGTGIAELCQAVSHWLVPVPPLAGTAVPFTPTLCEAAERARELLRRGQAVAAVDRLVGWEADNRCHISPGQ